MSATFDAGHPRHDTIEHLGCYHIRYGGNGEVA